MDGSGDEERGRADGDPRSARTIFESASAANADQRQDTKEVHLVGEEAVVEGMGKIGSTPSLGVHQTKAFIVIYSL